MDLSRHSNQISIQAKKWILVHFRVEMWEGIEDSNEDEKEEWKGEPKSEVLPTRTSLNTVTPWSSSCDRNVDWAARHKARRLPACLGSGRCWLRSNNALEQHFPSCVLWRLYPLPFSWTFQYIFFFFLILFIYFWLCWVFIAVRGLSVVAESGGCSSLPCAGFSLQWLLLLWSMGSRHEGFSSCGARV